MKKCLTIFMAFLILVTSSPTNRGFHAILEVGIVVHHFIHHLICQQEQIGVLDFFTFYYSDHAHHDTNHPHEHDKLPFNCCHHHDHHPTGQQTSFVLNSNSFFLTYPNMGSNSNELIARSEQWCSSLYAGKIWQPPKV